MPKMTAESELDLPRRAIAPRQDAHFEPRRRRDDFAPRLRRFEAAQYLFEVHGVTYSKNTLAKAAVTGGGPRYRLFGRFPFYELDDLDAWVDERLGCRVRSSSELGG
jgi:hypothetical protein